METARCQGCSREFDYVDDFDPVQALEDYHRGYPDGPPATEARQVLLCAACYRTAVEMSKAPLN